MARTRQTSPATKTDEASQVAGSGHPDHTKQSTKYDHRISEPKWQQVWEERGLFQATLNGEHEDVKEKQYILFAFAYPSGAGLHVGHVESLTALDILARFGRMTGKRVFFPVGWDAFGLPAENYAIKTGVPPAVTTKQAIVSFTKQIKRLGISYDWTTEVATSHPEYYKWTQWLFLQLYDKELAYKKPGKVNWCPSCQTVLANEQVVEGSCERCDSNVIQKDLEQWYFAITRYADELVDDLEQVDWPEATKQQQVNWIGRKYGARVKFGIEGVAGPEALEVFTTRLDTIFGVTFVVVSPELMQEWMDAGWDAPLEVREYVKAAFAKTEEERRIGEKTKTGVNTGLLAVNPVSGESVSIFVADYVLHEYGTGAVMGVPGHDQRDWAFAQAYDLQVKRVIEAGDSEGEFGGVEDGALIESGSYSGMSSEEARAAMMKDHTQAVKEVVQYRLRDWLISRQRYWGAPIPIVYDPEGKPHPVREEYLPWLLPTDVEFKPTGESPLTHSQEFHERVERLYGKGWRPEYDTMDTFVDSAWYYYRYVSSRDHTQLADKNLIANWLPVDLYMIGPEHIVLHLLYSRFLTKFLRDQGVVSFDEPFIKMRHQGMILGPDHKKMSKSKGNVINPDQIVHEYGADTLRVYEMFMGPLYADKPWDPRAVAGVSRFLNRFFMVCTTSMSFDGKSDAEVVRLLHMTIDKVRRDLTQLKYNTAIAAMMELLNGWEELIAQGKRIAKTEVDFVVRLIAPLAPFLAEELWNRLHGPQSSSVHTQEYPRADEKWLEVQEVLVIVQVNGKRRGEITVPIEMTRGSRSVDDIVSAVVESGVVTKWMVEGEIKKRIWVPGKNGRQGLLNLVLS